MPITVKHKDLAWKLMRYLVDDLEREYIDSGTFMTFPSRVEDEPRGNACAWRPIESVPRSVSVTASVTAVPVTSGTGAPGVSA
jgi:hypothetical protein